MFRQNNVFEFDKNNISDNTVLMGIMKIIN